MKKLEYKIRHTVTSLILKINIRGSGVLSAMVARLLLPKPKGFVVLQTQHNFSLLIDPKSDSGVERCLYYYGTYEDGTLKLMERILKKGDTFVDVGANIGLMSIHAALIVGDQGRVYSFEAHPETAEILKKNIDLNRLSNITVVRRALGAVKSIGRIYSNWHINRGGASLIEPKVATDSFEVEIDRFDSYWSATSNDDIRLVKIDIEGFELEALKGFGDVLRGPDAPLLIVECSDKRDGGANYKHELIAYIKKLNDYRLYRLTGGKERFSKLVEIGGQVPAHDNVICLLQRHISTMDQRLFV